MAGDNTQDYQLQNCIYKINNDLEDGYTEKVKQIKK